MLYCKKCGKENPDNSGFCTHCGAPFDSRDQFSPIQTNQSQAPVNNYYDPRRSVRESELREMDKMLNYFSRKAPQYEELDSVTQNMNVLQRKLSKTPTAGIVFASLCAAFLLLAALIGSGSDVAITIFFVLAFAMGVPALIILTVYFISRAINKPKYKKYSERYQCLTEELSQYYLAYGYCPVGIEYTNPTDLQAIRGAILSGYADTSKDAVNYLAQKYHNETMEREAAATRRATTATAAFSAAHFFLK